MSNTKRLIDEAKSIYTAWNWDMLEAEMESGYDRGAFRELVTMYLKMADHIESPSNQGEAARLREALKELQHLISISECSPNLHEDAEKLINEALSSHTEDKAVKEMDIKDKSMLQVIYNRYDAETLISAIKIYGK